MNQKLKALGINFHTLTNFHRGTVAEITLNSEQLKEALKSAIVELLQDNKGEFYQLFAEIIEDVAMERAIEEGENTELVDRDTIFNILES